MTSLHARVSQRWRRFWVRFSGPGRFGKIASALASYDTSPYHGRAFLSYLQPNGFVAASAWIKGGNVKCGDNVYVGDGVIVLPGSKPGPIWLGDGVQLYGGTFLQTGWGGALSIGEGTHIQPGCHFHALVSDIKIGRKVEVAANCALYSYNHGFVANSTIMDQPLQSKGPITIGDGVWLGHGVIVLSGVTIEDGAVIGAGSVVSKNVPANSIAAGSPAKVLRSRSQITA